MIFEDTPSYQLIHLSFNQGGSVAVFLLADTLVSEWEEFQKGTADYLLPNFFSLKGKSLGSGKIWVHARTAMTPSRVARNRESNGKKERVLMGL